MEFEALIFDFDGLMIESEKIALRVWQEVATALGGEMDDAINRLLIGKTPAAGAAIVRDQLDLPIDAGELQKIYWERRTTRMCSEAEPVEGLEALILYLRHQDLRLGVASNSPTAYVEQVLQALELRKDLDCVIGSDQVREGKPSPDVYLETARRLAVHPDRILVLEDSPTGVTAAIRAGMTCYAIPNPDLSGEDFSQADQCFSSIPDVQAFLSDGLKAGRVKSK